MRTRIAFALTLLWSGLSLAAVNQTWVVALKGGSRPYLCNACALQTPFPDAQSLRVLNSWKAGQHPFDGPSVKGVSYKIGSDDKVILCSHVGCSTYTWEDSSGWSNGTFQREESHGSHRPG
jgi:hypothetical protein